MLRIEMNGRTPDPELLAATLLNQYGTFTALQVRDRRVRGLDVHLARLSTAASELFALDLDTDLVRGHLRHALTDEWADSAVRIQILGMDPAAEPTIVVILRPPIDMPRTALRLRSVRYQRPVAHIKQVGGSFGQIYHGHAVEHAGYDDALLTAEDGTVSETTVANIGFLDDDTITWPAAPALNGTTKQLLERHGPNAGLLSRAGQVTLADVAGHQTAFVANSQGIAPVAEIDGAALAIDEDLMERVYQVYASVPWDSV
jgi:branched-subunit amino acid aminotransferase/4-amino-4-deoxychorismate lyase